MKSQRQQYSVKTKPNRKVTQRKSWETISLETERWFSGGRANKYLRPYVYVSVCTLHRAARRHAFFFSGRGMADAKGSKSFRYTQCGSATRHQTRFFLSLALTHETPGAFCFEGFFCGLSRVCARLTIVCSCLTEAPDVTRFEPHA